jgi:hypothetical protein
VLLLSTRDKILIAVFDVGIFWSSLGDHDPICIYKDGACIINEMFEHKSAKEKYLIAVNRD